MSIINFSVDNAVYVGDGTDGVYYQTGQGPDGWYVTVVVDSETGSFVDTLIEDDGPYASEADAEQSGVNAAREWCHDNGVEYK